MSAIDFIRVKLKNNKSFIYYTLIGLSGVLIDVCLFTALVKLTPLPYQWANAISTTCGIINNFYWNARHNFKVHDRIIIRFLSFYTVGLLGLGLTALILHLGVEILHADASTTKAVSLIFVLLFQYTLNKATSFKKKA